MREIPLVNDQFYHVYNRGADRRTIFQDNHDYSRFVTDMLYLNDSDPLSNLHRLADKSVRPRGTNNKDFRNRLVDIIAWCLMPNHFHFVLRQRQEGGISKFLQKLSAGYTKYFNLKHERSGVLLQGAFKAKHIQNDAYLTHVVRYVHINPIALVFPDWEIRGIQNWTEALKFLDTYNWSSHLDYQGKPNFTDVLQKEFLPSYPELNERYVEFLSVLLGKEQFLSHVRN